MTVEAPNFVLFEQAVGYALFRVKEFDDSTLIVSEVEESVEDIQRFCSIVKLEAFSPFKNTEAALENCNCVAEGVVHSDLLDFIIENLPKKKKRQISLGVHDAKLAGAIGEQCLWMKCQFTGVVPQILRGVRLHFSQLIKGLTHHSLAKAQLSLAHSFSRAKIKFNVHRVDNMVIQAVALLEYLDKDINLFGMRVREWYAYHFPELFRIVPEMQSFIKCASTIMDRKSISETTREELLKILGENNEQKVDKILEAARTSMGMDILPPDMYNLQHCTNKILNLINFRSELQNYLMERMDSCAPSLCALLGEQVGAKLISHAGSLTNLAKLPASTVQIMGAEKALFRALKTKAKTPKYGLLFHSSYVGRASKKDKGRISRFLANKCSIASRLDCFLEVPVSTYGEFLKKQVDDRLNFFKTGQIPPKTDQVMSEARQAAGEVTVKILKKRKKELKRQRAEQEASKEEIAIKEEPEDVIVSESKSVKKVKKEKDDDEAIKGRKLKRSKSFDATDDVVEVSEVPKKKKKRKSKVETED